MRGEEAILFERAFVGSLQPIETSVHGVDTPR